MMKQFLLLIFSLFIFTNGYSQKLHRQYSFFPQEEGNVYFIYPQKKFYSPDKDAVKDLEYDITYISNKDSASFTFSYFTSQVVQANKVKLTDMSGNTLYEAPLTLLFTQPQKKHWHQRAQFQIPYDLLVSLFEKEIPFAIHLSGKKELEYYIHPNIWKKQSEMTNRVFEIVKYNR